MSVDQMLQYILILADFWGMKNFNEFIIHGDKLVLPSGDSVIR